MVDWGAGSYESTAAELEPVATVVVERAELRPGETVIDLACGTGNAALLAAGRRPGVVIGVDSAPRLLEIAQQRALAQQLDIEFREGDLLDLPLAESCADVVLSVFGIIFAPTPFMRSVRWPASYAPAAAFSSVRGFRLDRSMRCWERCVASSVE